MHNSQITPKLNNVYDDYNHCHNYIQNNKEISVKQEQLNINKEKQKTEVMPEQALKKEDSNDKRLVFSINEKTNQIIAKIVDISTDEVIREIPPEKIVEMIADMCERAGIFIDKRL